MKRLIGSLAALATLLFIGFNSPVQAAAAGEGRIITPASSVPGPAGRAHTNIVIYDSGSVHSDSQPAGETPASMGCVYQFTPHVAGCPKVGTTQNPSGGSGAVALVDAYDNPDATTDMTTYSTQWGLPAANFLQVYASGKKPQNNPGGWSLEEALDIEMAHAMAPSAQVILVEATTNSFNDLYLAEDVAGTMVASAGGGEVSNSWSGGEYSTENSDGQAHFNTLGAVYLASSGDSPSQVGVPSALPFVVSVGGTTINRNSGGLFTSESSWNDAGGGPSIYEPRPSYQNVIKTIVGSKRGTPDISFDANPSSGPAMYDADGGYGWIVVGGTSVSSPAIAGVLNRAGHFYHSTALQNTEVYTIYGNAMQYRRDYRDITSGSNGHSCVKGWDYCTGVGTPLNYAGK